MSILLPYDSEIDMTLALMRDYVYLYEHDPYIGMIEYRFVIASFANLKTQSIKVMGWQCNAEGKIAWRDNYMRGFFPSSLRKLTQYEKDMLSKLALREITFAEHEVRMKLSYPTPDDLE